MLDILKQNLKENEFEFYKPLDGSPFWRQVQGSKTMFYTDESFETYCIEFLAGRGHTVNRIEPDDMERLKVIFRSTQVTR